MNKLLVYIGCLVIALSCSEQQRHIAIEPQAIQHSCVNTLTKVIVYDIFSPPVASRIYAYSNLAYYEALVGATKKDASIITRLKEFSPLPTAPTEKINEHLSAAIAFYQVAEALIFSKDSIRVARKNMEARFGSLPEVEKKRSIEWGMGVAAVVLKRAAADHYKMTRGMPRYSVFNDVNTWQQTPPDYADAVEPNWRLIHPLLMDSAAQFAPPPPPLLSLTPSSLYFKELQEVMDVKKNLTKEQDTIAHYWDDNPFVTEHRGHLTYANKKTTPVGHWMGIVSIVSGIKQSDPITIAKAYALSSAAIFDGFIACWDEKFRSKTKRPVTVIRAHFDSEWNPLLQTPAFPEYTSGHSVISAAAAGTLTKIFGDNIAFTDTTELQYLGLKRSFPSLKAAANEAGVSRLYGGIHYRSAIEQGKIQGEKISNLYSQYFLN